MLGIPVSDRISVPIFASLIRFEPTSSERCEEVGEDLVKIDNVCRMDGFRFVINVRSHPSSSFHPSHPRQVNTQLYNLILETSTDDGIFIVIL